ncbi:unnamed protein product [Clonostachys chloroleuca]|uniref:Uncharacterized protein n=1 Tax=Clonostachys chloroleuca TaxID=1926264 RepID=A0AA35MDS5_9HYPO|nr:unnamed protein product [Clonostachys chloroleuca]
MERTAYTKNALVASVGRWRNGNCGCIWSKYADVSIVVRDLGGKGAGLGLGRDAAKLSATPDRVSPGAWLPIALRDAENIFVKEYVDEAPK